MKTIIITSVITSIITTFLMINIIDIKSNVDKQYKDANDVSRIISEDNKSITESIEDEFKIDIIDPNDGVVSEEIKDTDTLQIDNVVPKNDKKHIVKRGDTIWKISRLYSINPFELKAKNKHICGSCSKLSVGDEINL